MAEFKRGDHVFNNSVKQTLKQLDAMVQETFGQVDLRKDAHGLPMRIRRLRETLAAIEAGLNHPAFDLTVSKQVGRPGGDANSQGYGKAKEEMVFAFRQ